MYKGTMMMMMAGAQRKQTKNEATQQKWEGVLQTKQQQN
jgi:hypothetical protein